VDGTTAGAAAGQADGWSAGAAWEYRNCYDGEYAYSRTQGFNAGYNDPTSGYPKGYLDGDLAGQAAGYAAGYAAGQTACAPP
jgi:hypothetical protein